MARKKSAHKSGGDSNASTNKGKSKRETSKRKWSETGNYKHHERGGADGRCKSVDAGRTLTQGEKRDRTKKKGDLGTDSTGPELKRKK